MLRFFLKRGPRMFPFGIFNYFRLTALHIGGQAHMLIALRQQNLKKMKGLLRAGVSPDTIDPDSADQNSLLHRMIQIGWLEGVKILLEAGADPNKKNRNQETPLHEAVQQPSWSSVPIVECLIGAGAKVNVQDSNGRTPLHQAMKNPAYSLVMAHILLREGGDPGLKNCAGIAPADLFLSRAMEDLFRKHEAEQERKVLDQEMAAVMTIRSRRRL